MLYDAVGNNNLYGAMNSGGPLPGSYYSVYGGASGGCQLPGSGIAITGHITQSFTFDNSCQAPGFYGTATYSGSQGPVNACHPIIIDDFLDSGLTSPEGEHEIVTTNGANYRLTNFQGQPLWLRAYYDQAGTGSWVSTDDSVTFVSGTTPSSSGTSANASF